MKFTEDVIARFLLKRFALSVITLLILSVPYLLSWLTP